MATKKVATSLDLLLNELKNFKVESLSTAPATVAEGRVYFNTGDNTLYYGADSKWNPIATGGSVEEALKKLKLSLTPDNESTPTSWKLNLNGGAGNSVDVTDMMKNSSVIDIIQFKGETDGAGYYNESASTFTYNGSVGPVEFYSIAKGVSYLGLIIDDFGDKFDASFDKYRTLAFPITDFVDGVKGIMATDSAGSSSTPVPLQRGKVVLKGNNEIEPNVENNTLQFNIGFLSPYKIYDKDWQAPGDAVKGRHQSEVNTILRDYAVSTKNELDSLTIEYSRTTRTIQLKMGETDLGNPISASDFVKDGMLKTVVGPHTPPNSATTEWTVSVPWSRPTLNGPVVNKDIKFTGLQYGKTYLGFIWDTDTSSEDEDPKTSLLDVSKLAEVYTAGAGIRIVDNEIYINLANANDGDDTEGYLFFTNGRLATRGIDDAIDDAVDDAKTELQSSINSLEGRVSTNEEAIQSHDTTLSEMNATITEVESDYKKADAALLGENDDRTSANTIYGVRNYATYVASRMAGYYLSKRVTSGNSVALYANPDSTVTTNASGVAIDLASIFVTVGAPSQTEVEVEVQTAPNGTVALSWSGLTLSGGNPLIIRYRVIRTKTDA